MGIELDSVQQRHLLGSMASAHSDGPVTAMEKFRQPTPEPDVREWATEEPTGLLNRYGRPAYRLRRITAEVDSNA